MTMPGYWLEKSIDRFSMFPPSHKSFFSSSYNLEKTFGTLFNGHGLTQLANGHTYVMTRSLTLLQLGLWKLKLGDIVYSHTK